MSRVSRVRGAGIGDDGRGGAEDLRDHAAGHHNDREARACLRIRPDPPRTRPTARFGNSHEPCTRPTNAEKKELAELRRRTKQLEAENAILKRAAAYFASENVLPQ